MYSRIFSAPIAIMCCGMLTCPPAVRSASPAQENQPPRQLHIVFLEGGEGAINNLKTKTAREVVVRVDDENKKPVGGALVTFALPNDGAGGNALNGGKIIQSVTDTQGRATARFLPSREGQFNLKVTASLSGSENATAVITQTNSMFAHPPVHFLGMSGKTLAIVGSVVGAGTAAAVVATQRGGGGATVSAGATSVGPPR